ncbi:hypothetical protein GCM10027157_16670 [Corynebacterium aquatimens]|uniref:Mutator family transposase n=1 Tax=Corynebacterium aquatimens TaxID=1190508 RepID=A0A931E579_9CORY|nr:transposase-like protein [Corynebacterium aquatimens]
MDDLLAQASPDLMRQMLQGFINQILSAQADTVCGAEYGVASTERVNHRNGYRHRDLDTRVGTIDVAVPKLRHARVLPRLATRAPLTSRTRAVDRDRDVLPQRGLHPPNERSGGNPWDF